MTFFPGKCLPLIWCLSIRDLLAETPPGSNPQAGFVRWGDWGAGGCRAACVAPRGPAWPRLTAGPSSSFSSLGVQQACGRGRHLDRLSAELLPVPGRGGQEGTLGSQAASPLVLGVGDSRGGVNITHTGRRPCDGRFERRGEVQPKKLEIFPSWGGGFRRASAEASGEPVDSWSLTGPSCAERLGEERNRSSCCTMSPMFSMLLFVASVCRGARVGVP